MVTISKIVNIVTTRGQPVAGGESATGKTRVGRGREVAGALGAGGGKLVNGDGDVAAGERIGGAVATRVPGLHDRRFDGGQRTGFSDGPAADEHAAVRAGAARVIEGVQRAVIARAAAASRELREKLGMALEHAELLTAAECEILLAIAEQGFTVRALARVSGRSERDIRRTLCEVAARADAPLFRFVVKTRRGMPPRVRAVAEAVVLRGGSLRGAAAELGLTVWAVRQSRDKLLARFVTREQT